MQLILAMCNVEEHYSVLFWSFPILSAGLHHWEITNAMQERKNFLIAIENMKTVRALFSRGSGKEEQGRLPALFMSEVRLRAKKSVRIVCDPLTMLHTFFPLHQFLPD